jgi:hypothetical protein
MTKTTYWQTIVRRGPTDPVNPPHLSTAERDDLGSNVYEGSLIFNTDREVVQVYQGGGWVDQISQSHVKTIAALEDIEGRPQVVFVESLASANDGINVPNDGGGGVFFWVPLATDTADGINIITPAGAPFGRYIKLTSTTSVVSGSTWFEGSGAPDSELGVDGDFYLRTDTYDVYRKASGSWSILLNIKGATGTAGATWYSGLGAPSNGTGVNGDFYLRTDTSDVYTKSAGSWSIAVNIKGATGTNGATWYSGSGAPSNGTGANGDFYLRTDTYDVYTKSGGSWSISVNIKGATGTAGATWYSGSGAPSSGLGANGDFYLRTDTYDVYTKSGGSWSISVNIKGATGATGPIANTTSTSYTPNPGDTVTLDVSSTFVHRITMPAGNITIALSNDTNAVHFQVSITQDGVGGRTVTWFSTIKWPGGNAPTLTTTAGKRDTFGFERTGSGTYDGFIIGMNI